MNFTLNSKISHRDTFRPYLVVINAKNQRLIRCEVAQKIFKTIHWHQKTFDRDERRAECEMAFIGVELYDEGYNCGPTVVGESGKSFNEICTLERINNGRQQLHRCFHPGYYCLALVISCIFYPCAFLLQCPPFLSILEEFLFPCYSPPSPLVSLGLSS